MKHSKGILNWDSIYGSPEDLDSDRAVRQKADVA